MRVSRTRQSAVRALWRADEFLDSRALQTNDGMRDVSVDGDMSRQRPRSNRQGTSQKAVDDTPYGKDDPGRVTYPFMPVTATPWMKVRWVKKKSTMIGSTMMVEAAISRCHSVPPCWLW